MVMGEKKAATALVNLFRREIFEVAGIIKNAFGL